MQEILNIIMALIGQNSMVYMYVCRTQSVQNKHKHMSISMPDKVTITSKNSIIILSHLFDYQESRREVSRSPWSFQATDFLIVAVIRCNERICFLYYLYKMCIIKAQSCD